MTTLNSNALCTRLQIKNFLNINQADSVYDNLCHELINRISQSFEKYCGRIFHAAEYTEIHDGKVRKLFPNQYPVNNVISIHQDSDWKWGTNTLIPSASYQVIDKKYIIYDGIFTKGEGSIKIVYNGGFESIPEDLVQACIEEVGRKLKHRQDYDEQVKTIGDGSVTFISSEFLPQTLMTLKSYRVYAGI